MDVGVVFSFVVLSLIACCAEGTQALVKTVEGNTARYDCCSDKSFGITLFFDTNKTRVIEESDRGSMNITFPDPDGFCQTAFIPQTRETDGILVSCYYLFINGSENTTDMIHHVPAPTTYVMVSENTGSTYVIVSENTGSTSDTSSFTTALPLYGIPERAGQMKIWIIVAAVSFGTLLVLLCSILHIILLCIYCRLKKKRTDASAITIKICAVEELACQNKGNAQDEVSVMTRIHSEPKRMPASNNLRGKAGHSKSLELYPTLSLYSQNMEEGSEVQAPYSPTQEVQTDSKSKPVALMPSKSPVCTPNAQYICTNSTNHYPAASV